MNNTEIEMEWIDAWNDLSELAGDRYDVVYLLPDWKEITLKECQGWLQTSAYQGYKLSVGEVYYQGKKALQVSRHQREE